MKEVSTGGFATITPDVRTGGAVDKRGRYDTRVTTRMPREQSSELKVDRVKEGSGKIG